MTDIKLAVGQVWQGPTTRPITIIKLTATRVDWTNAHTGKVHVSTTAAFARWLAEKNATLQSGPVS
jgi:hypothetical protein